MVQKQYNKLIIFSVIFLILINFSVAYYAEDVIQYYNFDNDNGNVNVLQEIVNNQNMAIFGSSNVNSMTGLLGNATNYSTTLPNAYYRGNFSGSGTSFTLNQWIYWTTSTNTQRPFGFYNGGSRIFDSLIVGSDLRIENSSGVYTTISNFMRSGWNMYSVTVSGDQVLIYRNATLITFFTYDLSNFNTLQFGIMPSMRQDETSIFSKALSSSELQTLYNQGLGLTYTDTILQSTGVGNTSFTAIPYTDNYCTYYGYTTCIVQGYNFDTCTGGFTVCGTEKVDYLDGIIYTYPAFQQYGLSYSQLSYQVNSSQNGYSQTICDYQDATNTEPLYNLTFDNCATATDCGFNPTTNIEWSTQIFNAYSGRQLALYNSTDNELSRDYNMPNLYNTDYFIWLTTFDYRPADNTATTFTILSPFQQELVNVLIERNGGDVCYYSVSDSYTLADKEVMTCTDGYTGLAPLEVTINFDSANKRFYVESLNPDTNSLKISTGKDSLNVNYGYNGIRLTTNNLTNASTYIDNIMVYGNPNEITLSSATVPFITTCVYDIGSCYDTRIYYAWTSNDLTTYQEYRVCGVNSQLVSNGTSSTTTIADTEGFDTMNNFFYSLCGSFCRTSGGRITVGFFMMFLTVLLAVVGFAYADLPAIFGVITGGFLALLLFMVLAFIGWFPWWFLILFVIVAGALLVLVFRLIFTGG